VTKRGSLTPPIDNNQYFSVPIGVRTPRRFTRAVLIEGTMRSSGGTNFEFAPPGRLYGEVKQRFLAPRSATDTPDKRAYIYRLQEGNFGTRAIISSDGGGAGVKYTMIFLCEKDLLNALMAPPVTCRIKRRRLRWLRTGPSIGNAEALGEVAIGGI
jgi:hypothetical protein